MRFEVEADSDAQEQASGIQRRVQSTVMMPMDTWVTVAESGVQSDRRTRQQAGLYSTDESQQSQWLLQIRVRRP
jgi:hypothetical protein